MNRLLTLFLSIIALVGLLIVSRAPFRRRRLQHNFDFVRLQMSEETVAKVLGEPGTGQPCNVVLPKECDHQAVYYLKGSHYLAVAFDKQGRAIAKFQSP